MSVAEYLAMGKKTGKKGHPEHDEQKDLFTWATLEAQRHPELELLHAVPNGAFYGGHWSTANKMKAEGVKKGVPDVFLPVPMTYMDKTTGLATSMVAGLWIEMKAPKGRTSPEQEWWIEKLREYGYIVEVCYSTQEAIKTITDYLSWDQE